MVSKLLHALPPDQTRDKAAADHRSTDGATAGNRHPWVDPGDSSFPVEDMYYMARRTTLGTKVTEVEHHANSNRTSTTKRDTSKLCGGTASRLRDPGGRARGEVLRTVPRLRGPRSA